MSFIYVSTMKLTTSLVVLSIAINTVSCARILIIFQMPSKSHYILGNTIGRILMEAGHDITMISPFSEKNPPKRTNGSWTEYIITPDPSDDESLNFFDFGTFHPLAMNIFVMVSGVGMTERSLNDTVVQKLLKSDAKFDLVIVEQFSNDALKGFAYYYNAPLILVSSMGANPWVNTFVGNPGPPSYIPNLFLSFSSHMTFIQRVQNCLYTFVSDLVRDLIAFPLHNRVLEKYFPHAPDLSELNYNVSLVLLNSHVSSNQPKPHVPSMIEIGGYHIDPPKPLPRDIQEYLDSASEGVVYFSMGSNLKSVNMAEKQKQAILGALSKLKQKVLWKFEDENLPGKSPNVKISKWLPQQDILAHPNVKLFITHGGLLSTIETVYYGVPVLAIPIYGDQKMNAIETELNGFGLYLSFLELTEEKISNALNELLTNPKYRENAQKRKAISRDRQSNPRESLVYWVEYVLRHQGAPHLRVSALDLAWYQYILLDVFAFLIVISLFVLFITYRSVKFIARKCRKQNNKEKTY